MQSKSTAPNLTLEYLFSFSASFKMPMEIIGKLPEGLRINAYSIGGEISGPGIQGKLLPVGGDWLVLQSDGLGVIDDRLTFETDDGALVYVTADGLCDFGEDGLERTLDGTLSDGPWVQRLYMRFHTTHEKYKWLNREVAVAIGEAVIGRSVEYQVFGLPKKVVAE